MKTKKIKFFSDAGHGWLKVKRSELKKMNLLSLISPCSYQRKDHVYLEEDQDASFYIDKLKKDNPDIVLVWDTKYSNRSRVRSYSGFYLSGHEELEVNKKLILKRAIINYERYGQVSSTTEDYKLFIDTIKLIEGSL